MKKILCVIIALIAVNALVTYAADNENGICYDSYDAYVENGAVQVKTLNLLESGNGWGSPWSEGNKSDFATGIKSERMYIYPAGEGFDVPTLFSDNLSAGYYRKTGFIGDLSQNGEYFAKISLFYQFAANTEKKHNLQLNLGDGIIFGSEKTVRNNEEAIYPYLSVDGGISKIYADYKLSTRVTYEIALHIISKENGKDEISVTFNNLNSKINRPLAMISTETESDMVFDYFGIRDAAWLTYRIRNIQIEGFSEKIGNIGKLDAVKEKLPESYEKFGFEEWKSVMDALSEIGDNTYTKRYFIDALPNKVLFSKGTFSDDGKAFGVQAVNTGDSNEALRVYLAYYDGDVLKEMSMKEYKIQSINTAEEITVALKTAEGDNPDVRCFIWNTKINPLGTKTEFLKENYSEIFVSPNSENGDGSFENPFKTIKEARDYLRNHKDKAYVVYLRGGTYNLSNQVIFDKTDSRSRENRVIYKAYPGEKPVLSGGIDIPAECFDEVTDNDILKKLPEKSQGFVKKIDLKKLNLSFDNELSVYGHSETHLNEYSIPHNTDPDYFIMCDNKMMINARWPNSGFALIKEVVYEGSMTGKRGFQFRIEDEERMKKWETATDMAVHGYWFYNFSDLATPASVNSEKNFIETVYPSGKGVKENRQFYVYNLLEELDSSGEWYIDRENEILYFYPPKNAKKVTIAVQRYSMLRLVNLENTEFSGITIMGTRGRGIDANNCNNVCFSNITVNGTGLWGVYLSDCTDCTVRDSQIYNCGFGGIYASGGDLKTGVKGNIIVKNNDVYNYSMLKKGYSFGISISGYENKALSNVIHDAPQQAAAVNGNENMFSENTIYNVLSESSDMGAIYMGQSKTSRGNIISKNIIKNLKSQSVINPEDISAVYLDDLLDGYTVTENTFENIKGTGVVISGGRVNTVTKNTFIENKKNVDVRAVGIEYQYKYTNYIESLIRKIENGDYSAQIYGKYPHLLDISTDEPYAPKYNVVKDNVSFGSVNDIVFSAYSLYGEENIIKNNTIIPSEIRLYRIR